MDIQDDDDWLDSAPEGQGGRGGAQDPLADREYERLASRYSDAGYREGIIDGKLSTLQQGFDQSFALSVPPSRALGNLRGQAAALLSCLTSSTSTIQVQGQGQGVPGSKELDLTSQVRSLLSDLNRIKRSDVLPIDQERLEHERTEHPEEDGAVLDVSEGREMEGLEGALAGLGQSHQNGVKEGGNDTASNREELIRGFERRLQDVRGMVLGRLG